MADDDESFRKLMVKTLGRFSSFSIAEASNGVEACIKLGTYRPDLLVLDINMPEMDGREVCKWILSEPALSETKVIIITGHPESPEMKEIIELGFGNVLLKPFHINTLMESVKRELGL